MRGPVNHGSGISQMMLLRHPLKIGMKATPEIMIRDGLLSTVAAHLVNIRIISVHLVNLRTSRVQRPVPVSWFPSTAVFSMLLIWRLVFAALSSSLSKPRCRLEPPPPHEIRTQYQLLLFLPNNLPPRAKSWPVRQCLLGLYYILAYLRLACPTMSQAMATIGSFRLATALSTQQVQDHTALQVAP